MERYLPFCTSKLVAKVKLSDIYYIRQNLRKVEIFTKEEELQKYGKICEFNEFLDEHFLRCHSSLIVNLQNVVRISNQTIYFRNNISVSLGRENYAQAKQHFARYMVLDRMLDSNRTRPLR